MVPIKNALEKLATELGKTEMNYERLCKDNDVIQVGIFENTSFIRKIKVKLFIYYYQGELTTYARDEIS